MLDTINGFSVNSSTDEPTEMDDITLTCKASVYNYTQLNWVRIPINEKSEEKITKENITGIKQTLFIVSLNL